MNDFPDFEIRAMSLSGNIEVRKMGEHYPIAMLQPRHYSFFILFWATEGKGTHLIEHTIYDIIPGRLFLIHPGHLYQIKAYPKQGWMILFSHAMFLTFIKQHTEQEEAGMFSFYNLVPHLDLMKNRGLFQNLAKRLYEEINIESHISVLQHYLSIFLLHINSNYAVQQKITFISPATRMTLKLKKLIHADYLKNRDAKHYANKLGTTPRILNRLSEKMLGHFRKTCNKLFGILYITVGSIMITKNEGGYIEGKIGGTAQYTGPPCNPPLAETVRGSFKGRKED